MLKVFQNSVQVALPRITFNKVVSDQIVAKDISLSELEERFKLAKKLLISGNLQNTKRLIEVFIEKVVLYEDHINVNFNFHPELPSSNDIDEGLSNSNNENVLMNNVSQQDALDQYKVLINGDWVIKEDNENSLCEGTAVSHLH